MEMFSEKGVGVGEREDLKKNTEGGEEQGFRLQRDLIKWGGAKIYKDNTKRISRHSPRELLFYQSNPCFQMQMH